MQCEILLTKAESHTAIFIKLLLGNRSSILLVERSDIGLHMLQTAF